MNFKAVVTDAIKDWTPQTKLQISEVRSCFLLFQFTAATAGQRDSGHPAVPLLPLLPLLPSLQTFHFNAIHQQTHISRATIAQARQFFKKNGDRALVTFLRSSRFDVPVTCQDGRQRNFNVILSAGLDALRWCWELAHQMELSPINTRAAYEGHRLNLLLMFDVIQERLPPCLHYLTNHFIEDFLRFKRLGLLVCEGGEHRNSQIKSIKNRCTGQGAVSPRFRQKTGAVICNKIFALSSLLRYGIIEL